MKPLRCFFGFHDWHQDEPIVTKAASNVKGKMTRALINQLEFITRKCERCGLRQYKDKSIRNPHWHEVDSDRKFFILTTTGSSK